MVDFIRTDSNNKDFQVLVALLDQDLRIRDGADHTFYAQYNKLDHIHHVIVAYWNNTPAGCGAIKAYHDEIAEIKRMFVHPAYRRKGIARLILQELEKWASELDFTTCILETGKRQPEAIALYKSWGYAIIPNYGQYENVENSVCMQKIILPNPIEKANLIL